MQTSGSIDDALGCRCNGWKSPIVVQEAAKRARPSRAIFLVIMVIIAVLANCRYTPLELTYYGADNVEFSDRFARKGQRFNLHNLELRQILDIHHADEAVFAVHHEQVVNGVFLKDFQNFDGQVLRPDGDGRTGHDGADG